MKLGPLEEKILGFFYQINGENQRKQRMACLKCHRAPPHLEFALECETQRIHLRRILSLRRRIDGLMVVFDAVDDQCV